MIAGGLVALAIYDKPGGIAVNDIPNIFVSVVGRYIN